MRLSFLFFASFFALAGCYDPEERAQKHYEGALALFEAGDDVRAMLELRNVLQDDGQHFEGRKLFADTLLAQGDVQGAYSQYLRLIEQYPDTVEVRRLMAEISLDTGNRSEFERHSRAAIELAPDVPEHQALGLMLEYSIARQSNDDISLAQAVEDARALLEDHPELDTALRLLVDWTATGPDPAQSLPYIENLLRRHPTSQSLMMARLRALEGAGRDEEVGVALLELFESAPENVVNAQLLLSWYISRGEMDVAETFLRERAGADDDPIEGHMAVVEFLRRDQGPDTALEELERLGRANADTELGLLYAAQAAGIRFETGADRDPGTMESIIAEMQDLAAKNDAQIVLINMYRTLENHAKVQEISSEILEQDPFHVDALVVRALTQIQQNNPSGAINDLRAALDQSPRNVPALLLLANAHQLLGNVELAEQRLAQAVEISDSAPESAIAFAQFQIRRGNLETAQLVLNDSLENNFSTEVATLQARLLLQLGDQDAVRTLLQQLEASEDPNASELIRDLRVSILFNENRIDDSLEALQNYLDENGDGSDDLATELQILRIRMLTGRFDETREQLVDLRARFPESQALVLIEANLLSLEGKIEESIVLFRELLEIDPEQLIAIQRLYRLLQEIGDSDAASELLVSSLEHQPDARPLILLLALEQEQKGEFGAAIDSYKNLYVLDPSDLVVANNYASMLAYYTDDVESLALAETVSAPLNGLNVPAFLDTLGYINLRQGDLSEAIRNFEVASRELPENATLAFNLATAYMQIGREDEAIVEFERGFQLAEGNPDVPKHDEALISYENLTSDND